jgi:Polysaccharide deacetylase
MPHLPKPDMSRPADGRSHTWSHADLSKLTPDQAKEEIEKGVSAVRVALGQPEASFFRFPALRHSPELLAYLSARNIGIFSTDMDSFDFKMRKPEQVVDSVVSRLKKHGKGIVLMHDFQHPTSLALPELLVQLKTSRATPRASGLPGHGPGFARCASVPNRSENVELLCAHAAAAMRGIEIAIAQTVAARIRSIPSKVAASESNQFTIALTSHPCSRCLIIYFEESD